MRLDQIPVAPTRTRRSVPIRVRPAPACINVLAIAPEGGRDDGRIVRTVNYIPYDPLHPRARNDDGALLGAVPGLDGRSLKETQKPV